MTGEDAEVAVEPRIGVVLLVGAVVQEEVKKRVPAKRLGEAVEIADAVLYLASDSAAYLTGQILTVDGGLTA